MLIKQEAFPVTHQIRARMYKYALIFLVFLTSCAPDIIENDQPKPTPKYYPMVFICPVDYSWDVNGVKDSSDTLDVTGMDVANVTVELKEEANICCILY